MSIFESKTNMTDQNYYILFDYLKWVQSDLATEINQEETLEKFSACCFVPKRKPFELECPFETPLNENRIGDTIKWKPGKLLCPKDTTKV